MDDLFPFFLALHSKSSVLKAINRTTCLYFFPPNKIAEKKKLPKPAINEQKHGIPRSRQRSGHFVTETPEMPPDHAPEQADLQHFKGTRGHFREIRPDPRRERANARSDRRASNAGRI